jgi:hypothetical protein
MNESKAACCAITLKSGPIFIQSFNKTEYSSLESKTFRHAPPTSKSSSYCQKTPNYTVLSNLSVIQKYPPMLRLSLSSDLHSLYIPGIPQLNV